MRQEIKDRIEKIKNGEVPEGYYEFNSEILPETWTIEEMKDICEKNFVGIASSTTQHVRNKGVPLIRNQNITENKLNTDEILYITEEFDVSNKSKRIKENDILTVRTGFTGISCVVPKTYKNAQTFTTLISRPNLRRVNPNYLCYYLNSNVGKSKIDGMAYGNAQKNLNVSMIEILEVILPPTHEQEKIATILSTWDKAIELKENLIEEKKKQKKGLMQRLLTGEVRLPGFDGEWKEVSFSECFTVISVKKHQVESREYQDVGEFPIVDQGKRKIIGFSNNKEKVFRCPKSGVIVFGDHTRELKFIDFDFIVGADGTQVLDSKEGIDIRYLYYSLQIKKIPNTGYNRHFKFIKEMIFEIPSLQEQEAIADILSTADKEISLLEQEQEALKLQKKGLMQLLLTGIVRVNTEN